MQLDIDVLIAKFLASAISPEEAQILANWVQESDENRNYLTELTQIWAIEAVPLKEIQTIDTEAALTKVKSKFKEVQSPKKVSFGKTGPWLVAAMVLVGLFGMARFFVSNIQPEIYTSTRQQYVSNTTLSDGSVASINKNSQIVFETQKNERRLKLTGEAYFKVTKDNKKPFIVSVNQLKVRVVGTEFNVDNRTDTTKVKVFVYEGKVVVSFGGQILDLVAGESAIFDCQTTRLQKTDSDRNELAYRDMVFVFEDTPLSSVLRMLNKAYDADVQLSNPALADCKLYVTFKNEPLEVVLEVIAATLSLKLKNNDGTFILSGDVCNE